MLEGKGSRNAISLRIVLRHNAPTAVANTNLSFLKDLIRKGDQYAVGMIYCSSAACAHAIHFSKYYQFVDEKYLSRTALTEK